MFIQNLYTQLLMHTQKLIDEEKEVSLLTSFSPLLMTDADRQCVFFLAPTRWGSLTSCIDGVPSQRGLHRVMISETSSQFREDGDATHPATDGSQIGPSTITDALYYLVMHSGLPWLRLVS